MEECSVLIETTKSAEDKTSRWFDLPIDYELFRDLLGVEADSNDYQIIDMKLPFAGDIVRTTSVRRLNKLYFAYTDLSPEVPLGSALAEQAADAAEAELRQWAAGQDRYLTGRFSPGYGDWPIGVQPLVAAALDTARRVGLCVTENDLMTPRKSVTALLGLSDHPVKGHLAGCGHCVLNTRCEYRKRGKTCASE